MATYIEMFNMAYEGITGISPLRKKVAAAVATISIGILSEASGTANHQARVRWARQTLRDVLGCSNTLLWAVLQNSVVANAGDNALDADVHAAVAAKVDDFTD